LDLLLLGILFLVGLLADVVGRRTAVPRVSILLLSGLLIGPSLLGIISTERAEHWFPQLTHMALGMVGFLMAQNLTAATLRDRGRAVVTMSLVKVLGASLSVFVAALLLDLGWTISLVLAGIAPATAPAATYDVVHETGASGEFADTLLNVVALDDIWGLILFSFLLAFAANGFAAPWQGISEGLFEIGASIMLGVALGLPMAYLTGRIVFGEREGEPILAESLGFVFLGAGAASLLGLSPIIAAIAMGAVVANFARHHSRPFHAIEGVEWPFMILFFVIAGASLHVDALSQASMIVIVYIIFRALGIVGGVFAGGKIAGFDKRISHWMGIALLPQAGVALGMALIAAHRFPEQGQTILTVVLASTVLLELGSPLLTRWVLRRDQANYPETKL